MKKVLIVLLVLSITITVYAVYIGAGVTFVRPLHPQINTVGLVGHWKLWDGLMTTDEVFDYTCRGHNGALQDGGTTLVPTYPGFDFDGTDDYISIIDHADLTPAGTDLVTNGDFGHWTADNPDDWIVTGEVAADPMVNEVGAGQGQGGAGTGYCNIYTSTGAVIDMYQTITTVIGQTYRIRININKVTAGGITITDGRGDVVWDPVSYSTTGIKTFDFTATITNPNIMIARQGVAACDVTFDDVSVALVTPFSISAWVYMHDADRFHIASKGLLNVDAEWLFNTNSDGELSLIIYDNWVVDCYIRRRDTTDLRTAHENQWLHVAATYDGGTSYTGMAVYLNGADAGDAGNNIATFVRASPQDHNVWIGRYGAAATAYSDGLIDDVTIWKKELSAIEVRNIYEVTKWRYQR